MTLNRTALVAGGTAGIGRSVVKVLVRDGWKVVACARRIEDSQELQELGVQVVSCDVSDADSVSRMVHDVSQALSRIGALINCAGIALPRTRFATTSEEDMERIFSINAFGTIRMTRAILPLMSDGGTIVNLSSTLSMRPRPGSVLYAATKGAIEAFTTALATEVSDDNIRVHVVAPALVRSRIWLEAGTSKDDYAKLLKQRGEEFPLGRAGEPEDVSELIAFLVSSKAAWLTGNLIQVDGGAMLR